MPKTVIATAEAPAAVGPYSQAIKANGFIFTAGQLGLDPATGKLAGDDVASQAKQALQNIRAVLEASGTSIDNVVKTTVFLTDMNDYKAVNAVYATFFTKAPPARSAVQVAALPLGGLVEIETIAHL